MDSTTLYIVIATIGVGILAFIVAYFLYRWVKKLPSDNETIEKVGGHIRRGANTFLKREYMVLAIFAGIVALLILLFLPEPIWVGGALENVLTVSYTHLRAHETTEHLVCRLLLEQKKETHRIFYTPLQLYHKQITQERI